MEIRFDQSRFLSDDEQGYADLIITLGPGEGEFSEDDSIAIGRSDGTNTEFLQPDGETWSGDARRLILTQPPSIAGKTAVFVIQPIYIRQMDDNTYTFYLLGPGNTKKAEGVEYLNDIIWPQLPPKLIEIATKENKAEDTESDNNQQAAKPEDSGGGVEEASDSASSVNDDLEAAIKLAQEKAAREAAERAAREQAIREAQEQAAREAAEKAAREAEEKAAREEAERAAREEEERKAREEEERKAREEEEQRARKLAEKEEAERAAQEAAERERKASLNQGQPEKKSKLGLIAAVIVALLAIGGAGAWFFLSKGEESKPVAEKEATPAPAPKEEPVTTMTRVRDFFAGERSPEKAMELAKEVSKETTEEKDAVFRLYYYASENGNKEGTLLFAEAIDPSLPDFGTAVKNGAQAYRLYGQLPDGEQKRAKLKEWVEAEAKTGNSFARDWLQEMR